jgi:hypothetical protein
MKKAVSVTIHHDNLLWLRGQADATAKGSLSDILDRLVTEARLSGRTDRSAIRSVKGSVDLPDDDPDLEKADAYVRSLFQQSVGRPMLVRETPPKPAPKKAGKRG